MWHSMEGDGWDWRGRQVEEDAQCSACVLCAPMKRCRTGGLPGQLLVLVFISCTATVVGDVKVVSHCSPCEVKAAAPLNSQMQPAEAIHKALSEVRSQ